MKRIIRFLLSKTFLFALMGIAQIVFFALLVHFFSSTGTFLYGVITLLSVVIIIAVVEHDNLNPAYRMMWVTIVAGLPVTGALFYLWWGSQAVTRKNAARFADGEQRARAALVQDERPLRALAASEPTLRRSVDYLCCYGGAPLYGDTACEYFPLGEKFFERFLQELKKARHSIYMEYFIIEEGWMWGETLAVLREKAAAGVDVRLIYDGFGSMFTLPDGYDAQLRALGIKCCVFGPLRFSLHVSDYKMLNHRDHRKITVIDGETGFTGGLNLADEYVNRKLRCGQWKDTGLMLKGSAVFSLTVTFLKMWDYLAGTQTRFSDFVPAARMLADGWVQPYCDSPLDGESVSENAYLNVLRRAERYVYIATPYLIIDHEMISALCLAAKSGIDVRILTPGIPDKRYVYLVTRSYYETLLEAGVRIFEYTPGFVHAKMYVSDDKEAIVGSANMDYRSLYLHFENCCAFYGGHMVRDVRDDMLACFAKSREIMAGDMRRRSVPEFLCMIFLRLFSPLM